MYIFFICLLVLVLITYVGFVLLYYFFGFDRNKISTFECGFLNPSSSRLAFSLRFFLILLVFIVFDSEISFVLNIPYNLYFHFLDEIFSYLLFLVALAVGTFEEWRNGIFDWKE